jgi:hypothetical protein
MGQTLRVKLEKKAARRASQPLGGTDGERLPDDLLGEQAYQRQSESGGMLLNRHGRKKPRAIVRASQENFVSIP